MTNLLSPAAAHAAAGSIRLRALSLGAGVQSTTLALMATHGEIRPMPDCAIFADTGWEPRAVYDHLAWLMSPNVLSFPVHVARGGDIRADLLRAGSGERWASIPAFTRTVRRGRVEVGMIRRQCTKDYKLVPIRRKVRALAGLTRRRSPASPVVEQWIGISLDEAIRMKPSREAWQINRWPLIKRRMTRRDCLRWLERHDYPTPPKSSCTPTPCGASSATGTLQPGTMRCGSTARAAPACAPSAARCSCTARPYRWTGPICRPLKTTASSACGATSARACVACKGLHPRR